MSDKIVPIEEIRVGNLFKSVHTFCLKVTGMSPFDNSVRCDQIEGCNILYDYIDNYGEIRRDYYDESRNLRGIPIEPTLLIGLGFREVECPHKKKKVWVTEHHIFENCKWHFTLRRNGLLSFIVKGVVVVDVKYIHQLQNLYHILTTQMLTIKSNKGKIL